MSYEVNINEETLPIQIISRKQNMVIVKLGEKTYELSVLEREPGVFSLLHQGKTYNFLLKADSSKKYKVTADSEILNVDIIDPESRYQKNRKGDHAEDADYISTPMPGQVVKILVEEGQEVKGGETVIIVSAMKMESEYKVVKDRVIKKILVKEGDKIDGDQPLILFES
ncbi:MAG: acetyl-CoA carboxylase biotin carboxyl carrier protein subunit [Bacteroidales bacterium]|nr:acetyl-CoA carboxylase biotin carboxyl carrier protein subunit [Bacteroidales bacterium]